ncbi:uncharacterized protein C4orf54-like [Brienomyrus brachyistius]|uniref:uncharacterized protein C4orf54-like n=1 Tax=Brienomyrus brachyistius TaxID=42636 RepID=UPI0020B39DE7|nr:uncharacterized protein C4orf54-like [Brienomyrus brachyistius]
MEALQKTYRGDTSPYRKLQSDKGLCNPGTQQEESKYVDLDDLLAMKAEGTKTVKVTFTGEGNQLAIIKCNNDAPISGDKTAVDCNRREHAAYIPTNDCKYNNDEHTGQVRPEKRAASNLSSETASSPDSPNDFGDCDEVPADKRDAVGEHKRDYLRQSYDTKNTSFEIEELHYTDMYLARKSESDDGVSVVLSENCTPICAEDESHYITTHEIQLLELDHDVDYDFGGGSCWDIEDDNRVYSFVDYASFDSDETIEEAQVLEDKTLAKLKNNQGQSNNTTLLCRTNGAAVSTKQEHDPCDLDKCASPDEILLKHQNGSGNSVGQIHLSIKTASRAINDRRNSLDNENLHYCAKHDGDLNGYVFKSQNVKAEATCDRSNCFIPAPGRLHIGSKLKGKDIAEYSSGASSSISEMDDADKEVRNLTTRAFRSLACPYFDAINFSTSSESSASEHGLGLNRWSAFVDLKCGNLTQGREQKMSHKSSASTFEINSNSETKGKHALPLPSQKGTQTKIFALNSSLPDPSGTSSSTKKIEVKSKVGDGQSEVITLTETLNFHCNILATVDDRDRHVKFAENAAGSNSADEVTSTMPSEPGTEDSHQTGETGEAMDDTQKKSIFASSLLKNVISKKMQFEQERKMERGEISDTFPILSPSFLCKDHEIPREKVTAEETEDLQRQASKMLETGSGITILSLDELGDIVDSNSCEPKDNRQRDGSLTISPEPNSEAAKEKPADTKIGASEATKSTLHRSHNSAFRNWREDGLEFRKEQESKKTPAKKLTSFTDNFGKANLDLETGNSRLTKMSHLFLPSIQLPCKDRGQAKTKNKHPPHSMTGQGELRDTRLSFNSTGATSGVVPSKPPGIKISLRSVKDNKPNPFNIANLLTPNIVSSGTSAVRSAGDSKCQTLITSLKGEMMEKVPHFIVRDIRDTKGKMQPPIYQVRDVRKLVKSSYHFVSLDNQENKPAGAADSNVEQKASKEEPMRTTASLSPLVIKCQSVNTNSNAKQLENITAVSWKRLAEGKPEVDTSSSLVPADDAKNRSILVKRATGRVPLATTKQKVIDAGERKAESKVANQAAIEKLRAAVKTMEQLYVFDRNEWKRKIQAPRPVTDSHVLSLITSAEQLTTGKSECGAEPGNPTGCAAAGNEKLIQANSHRNSNQSSPTLPAVPTPEEKEFLKTLHIPFNQEEKHSFRVASHQSGLSSSKTAFPMGDKTRIISSSNSNDKVLMSSAHPRTKCSASKSPEAPLSLKISQARSAAEEKETPSSSEGNQSALCDSENYLTIPVKCHAGREPMNKSTSTWSSTSAKHQDQSPASHSTKANARRHSRPTANKIVISETRSPDSPTATIYHHSLPLAAQGVQPQVLCFSQPVPTATATPSAESFQQTQRKMLLDPTTGHYYLVDTPVQPTTRRLFDPETRQYVDVPMSQPSVTPVPVSVSPLALSPSSYSPAYMIYPGFMPSTAMLPSQTPPETDSGVDKLASQEGTHGGQSMDAVCWESPYCSPTRWCPQGATKPQFITGRGSEAIQCPSDGKPIISITTQQGPRIIAPPSFDGTTMSFVVEHR